METAVRDADRPSPSPRARWSIHVQTRTSHANLSLSLGLRYGCKLWEDQGEDQSAIKPPSKKKQNMIVFQFSVNIVFYDGAIFLFSSPPFSLHGWLKLVRVGVCDDNVLV